MARKRPTQVNQASQEAAVSRLRGLGSAHEETSRFSWTEALPELVAAVVISVARRGGLASFGATRDGGAGTVTIFLDGDRTTVYIKPSESVDDKLAEIVDFMSNIPD